MTINRRRFLKTGAAAAAALSAPSLARAQALPRNVRLVIGSTSTGGDTYQNSSIVADALAEHLGINIRVDAVGASEAFRALGRDSRGTTLMTFHDQAYLGHLYGREGYQDPFATYTVGQTVSINPGNAYLVEKNAPWNTMEDIFNAAAAGERVGVAIQPGGVSEIGFSAMKNAAQVRTPGSEANIVAVNTGAQADKNQSMWDGLSNCINGSIQANEQFTQLPDDDRRAMKFVWITAREATLQQAPVEGMGATTRDDLLTYAAPKTSVTLDGSTDFTFDKEFFFLYNPEMDRALIDQIDEALAAVYAEGAIQQRQLGSFFIPNYLPFAEAQDHLRTKRDTYQTVLEKIA